MLKKPMLAFYIAWSDFLSVHKSFVPRVDNIFLETSSVPSLFALKVVRYLPLINRIRNPQICTRDCSINQFWAIQRLSHALNPLVQKFRNRKIIFSRSFIFSVDSIKILVTKYSGLGIFHLFQSSWDGPYQIWEEKGVKLTSVFKIR